MTTDLQTTTTWCHAWSITRSDGQQMGFTDHDQPLRFAGLTFEPDTGFSGVAVYQELGMSVDNSEALGAFRDDRISQTDLQLGRFDGAQVVAYRVDWRNPETHVIEFRGTIGQVITKGGRFQAELRGLSQGLNRSIGQSYQSPCSAVLGDARCGFDTTRAGYDHTGPLDAVIGNRTLVLSGLPPFDPDWFVRGWATALTGRAKGAKWAIKSDQRDGDQRILTLWDMMDVPPEAGDEIRIVTGCDKQFNTCRYKFDNAVNFRGFPDIPSSDWVMVHPNQSNDKNGGSRR